MRQKRGTKPSCGEKVVKDISDDDPKDYVPKVAKRFSQKDWNATYEYHAPPDGETGPVSRSTPLSKPSDRRAMRQFGSRPQLFTLSVTPARRRKIVPPVEYSTRT